MRNESRICNQNNFAITQGTYTQKLAWNADFKGQSIQKAFLKHV